MKIKDIPDDHPNAAEFAVGLAGTQIPMVIYSMQVSKTCNAAFIKGVYIGGTGCDATTLTVMPPGENEKGPLTLVCSACGRLHYQGQSFATVGRRIETWDRAAARATGRGINPKDIDL